MSLRRDNIKSPIETRILLKSKSLVSEELIVIDSLSLTMICVL